jgi:hypothetical protein
MLLHPGIAEVREFGLGASEREGVGDIGAPAAY